MNNHFTIFNVILSIFYENKRNIFNDELILILKEKGYDAFILSSFDDIKKSIKIMMFFLTLTLLKIIFMLKMVNFSILI